MVINVLEYSAYKNHYEIEVIGHTDDEPIAKTNPTFNSNWDLSAIRATGIVEKLSANGIDVKKLTPIGRAATEPLVPNRDENGEVIPENRAQNRRIELIINKYL